MLIDNLLKSMGLSYTTRHHLGERVRRIDWRFLAAVIVFLAGLIALLIYAR